MDEDGVQHVVIKCQSCCTHFCGKTIDPTHFLEGVARWRYLETIKAPGEVGYGSRHLRAVPCKVGVPRFLRRGTPVQNTLVTLVLESR